MHSVSDILCPFSHVCVCYTFKHLLAEYTRVAVARSIMAEIAFVSRCPVSVKKEFEPVKFLRHVGTDFVAVYSGCLTCGPRLTLIYFTTRSNVFLHVFIVAGVILRYLFKSVTILTKYEFFKKETLAYSNQKKVMIYLWPFGQGSSFWIANILI